VIPANRQDRQSSQAIQLQRTPVHSNRETMVSTPMHAFLKGNASSRQMQKTCATTSNQSHA
jgi:hypothetical protein